MHEFSSTLRDLARRSGKSPGQIAAASDVDLAYIRKLMTGTKGNPSVRTVIKLAMGLVFDQALLEKDPALVHAYVELLSAWLSDASARD